MSSKSTGSKQEVEKRSSEKPSSLLPAVSQSNPWDLIAVQSLVLWQADKEEGYFLCFVTAVSQDGQQLTLKWKDYPKLPEFKVRRSAVGLLRQAK